MNPLVKNTLLVLAALALISVLGFLYARTQAVDLRGPNEITDLLRVLKEIDGRWDVDVLRASLEADSNALPPIDRSEAAEFRLTALRNAADRTGSAALNTELPELTEAIRDKSRLVTKFRNVHDEARQALADLTTHARELPTLAAQLQVRSVRMNDSLARLNVAAPIYYTLGTEDPFNIVYASLNELEAAVAGFPQVLLGKAALVTEAGRVLLDRKTAANRLAVQIGRLTSGPRLDSMTLQFSQEIEALIQEKEIYRVYLITYAGALLVLIAWMGVKIKAAQVLLEHRVKERTRELSTAMRQLKESETQLIHSEKMSSLGQMVAGVAHEINTPLAYVKNSLGTVSEKLPELSGTIDEAERLLDLLRAGAGANRDELNRQFALVTQHISRLKQNKVVEELAGLVKDGVYGTGQMSEIVDNLKDFSRLDRSRVTQFNLNEGLGSTLVLAKHLLKTVTVEKHLGDIPFVVCSPTQINQVLLNLITNATQALERGRGTIRLRTRKEANGVAVDVEDTGHGIRPEILPKIFDPFFSTKDVGKGTGIGLSISYKIVQQHGGRIEVESEVGKGTRFTVHLPLKPPANAELGSQGKS
jgi:two-component system NtrC family sensor kinase